jgi:hypothetical protein
MTKQPTHQIIANCKEAKELGSKIDPETAEITCIFAPDLDFGVNPEPDLDFGVNPELDESQQVRGSYFARSPGIWVSFGDLPAATRDALRKRLKATFVEDDTF